MEYIWLWVVVALTCWAGGDAVDSDLSDLRLLPLDRLIAIKRALTSAPANDSDNNDSQSAEALPLRGDPGRIRPPNRRGGGWDSGPPPIWIEEVEVPHWKGGGHGGGGKGKGLEAIFQGTVTTLAFLAFGGYLICLLIHTLKEKKAALTMSMVTGTAVETRGRARRADSPSELSTDIYLVLRHLAEGYARYNQHCLDH